MKKDEANQILSGYVERIYAYMRRRISNPADVEDIAQETAFKLYQALCVKNVENVDAFVWTVARNTLVNYYRGQQKVKTNMPLEAMPQEISDRDTGALEAWIKKEDYEKIRREIAYLSKMQRKILIMYYYEERKQSEIAALLNIPIGTVKWHLNMAKSELKKGMNKVRNYKDLKFNPITFGMVGLSGGTGTVGDPHNFVRSALSQNILYCIRTEYKTIEEIADFLGVSPVYVESELDYLEEYQLVVRRKNRYVCNILIEEVTQESVDALDTLYRIISPQIVNRLYDEIINGGYLESKDILGPKDNNFRMWAILLYLLTMVESDSFKEKISSEQARTIRADGGENIITASVEREDVQKPELLTEFSCGACWNENEDILLWLTDGTWTEKRVTPNYGGKNIERDLRLLKRFIDGQTLSIDEYTFMLEKGYIQKTESGFALAIVGLKEGETKQKLFEITKRIKSEVLRENRQRLEDYKNLVLSESNLPENVKIQQEYTLQFLFHMDGTFIRYAKDELMKNGRLREVSDRQKLSVSEIAIIK